MFINLPNNTIYYIKHSTDNNPKQSDFPMHAHADYELLYFLSGDITYLVEGNTYTPQPHDILLFDIAETHKVIVNSNKPYERLVIQMDKNIFYGIDTEEALFLPFTNKKLGENNIMHPSDFKDDFWKKCLNRLSNADPYNKIDVITFLLPLLNEIKQNRIQISKSTKNVSLQSMIVQYVNDHLTQEIIPEEIAKHFFISRTALYSIFKQATGTGVHNYITVKRLIMAQSFLKHGEKPTKVYEKCGFKDYSTFYRAYKTHFGVTPKSLKNKI